MRENKAEIYVSTKSKPSPQNTTGRNLKTLKILRIICILPASSVRKRLKSTNRNECKNMRKLQHALC